nr:DNA adenine methylase [Actinomycetota bacterium]
MIKYLGSKRTLVPLIERVVGELPVRTACDLFAGTTRVGQALRAAGLRVVSNDLASYSEAFAQAYIAADERVDRV